MMSFFFFFSGPPVFFLMNVFIFKFLFIYSCVGSLLQRMGSSLLLRLTTVVVNKGCSPVVVCGLLVAVASPVVESAGPG